MATEDERGERISYKERMEASRAVEFIDALRAGVAEGMVRIAYGGEQIVVRPGKQVTLTVKARRRHDKESVSFKLEWREDVAAEDSDFEISTGDSTV